MVPTLLTSMFCGGFHLIDRRAYSARGGWMQGHLLKPVARMIIVTMAAAKMVTHVPAL